MANLSSTQVYGNLNVSQIIESYGDVSINDNDIVGIRRLDGFDGNHRIRFDSDNSWIEFTDQSNNRSEIVTEDVYIDEDSTWVGDHISDNSAHHSRYSDSEAISAVEGQSNLQLSGDLTVAGTITENNSI